MVMTENVVDMIQCNNVVKDPWRKQIKGLYCSEFLVSAKGRGLVSAIIVVITVAITELEGGDGCAKNMSNLLQ